MIRFNRAMKAASSRCLLPLMLGFALGQSLSAEPRIYTGLVVTDVRVGKTMMHNASLKITFEGDTEDISQVPGESSTECAGAGPYLLYLPKGVARMEIEFHGRTRTARLNDGQIFVALDTCSGGIGFGAFIGPKGAEPAYPLAFTLGTAEYAAITRAHPLRSALSTTGAAWSCIGYPPVFTTDQTPGTSTQNCTPPDTYPLKSDIGDIFVYQPYFEYSKVGDTAIASNHSGSTNRGAFLVRRKQRRTVASLSTPESDHESRVVYTLQTVADGSIGGHVFNQALVTFQMFSDTESVKSRPSPVNAAKRLYENRAGVATVTVDDGGEVINAEFAPGEVFVRYDAGTGVAGFGSKISPTYPIALNCSNSAYPSDTSYTVDCVQGDAWNILNLGEGSDAVFRGGTLAQLSYPDIPSAGVEALPQSLSQNTLLTGTAHACAGVYTIGSGNPDPDAYFFGDLGVCGGPAPRGLHTSEGALYLQDLAGGSLTLGNAPIVVTGDESGSGGGWDLANSGFLHVEVYKRDD